MGGNVSREVAISDEKSGTMSNSFSWSGTFPRGMSLEGNLSTKLTKFKKFEVTPKKKNPDTSVSVEEEYDGQIVETSDKEFIESILLNVLEDALENCGKKGMTKSSTLPANMKGLGVQRTQSFGKRIRKSIRKLVVKTPKKEKKGVSHGSSEDIAEALLVEVLSTVTGCPNESIENLEKAELTENVIEEETAEEDIDEAEDEIVELNSSKSFTLPANFKGLGQNMNDSFGKRIRKSLKKFVTPKKNKGNKESIAIAESIVEEIVDNILTDEAAEGGIDDINKKDKEIQEEANESKIMENKIERVIMDSSPESEDLPEGTRSITISDVVDNEGEDKDGKELE